MHASPRAEALAGEVHGIGLEAARARYGDAVSDERLLLRMMLPRSRSSRSSRAAGEARSGAPASAAVARRRACGAATRRRSDRAARPATAGEPERRRMSPFSGVEAVVFDVDGTLLHTHDPNSVRGATAIPGAIEAVQRVRASGRRPLLHERHGPAARRLCSRSPYRGLRTRGRGVHEPRCGRCALDRAASSGQDRARARGAGRRRAVARAGHRSHRERRASRRRRRSRRLGSAADLRGPARSVRLRLGRCSAPRDVDHGTHVLRQRRACSRLVPAPSSPASARPPAAAR